MEPPKQKLFQTTIGILKNEIFKYKTHGYSFETLMIRVKATPQELISF
jgi:hypothetical protein